MPCETPFQLCAARPCGPEIEGLHVCAALVAESAAMRSALRAASGASRSAGPGLLSGESGVGKEVMARAIHANGPRRRTPLATSLAGVALSPGRDLFVDDAGRLSAAEQESVLRALDAGTRILCASRLDLRRCIADGHFREDLYYRLSAIRIEVPPLRRRGEDLMLLADRFLARPKDGPARLTAAAREALRAWSWPGNVRELHGAMAHAAALSDALDVDVCHLPAEILVPHATLLRPLAEVERDHILRVLRACGGRQAETARVLGIGRTTLWRKLQEYGPPPDAI